jgi:hypothetical protein
LDSAGLPLGYAMPALGGSWWESLGQEVSLTNTAELRLAHPIDMSADEQSTWQRRVVTTQTVQPFKQVFRETYSLTPAEEQSGDVSHRFSAHVVPLRQVYALTRSRGWGGNLGLSGFDGAGQGCRDFPGLNVRAHLAHDDPDGQNGVVEAVWFQE